MVFTLVSVRRMSQRSAGHGRSTNTTLSSLPGRRMAGSMMSGRLEAAMMNTCLRLSKPSITVSSWSTTSELDFCRHKMYPYTLAHPYNVLAHDSSQNKTVLEHDSSFTQYPHNARHDSFLTQCTCTGSLINTQCTRTRQLFKTHCTRTRCCLNTGCTMHTLLCASSNGTPTPASFLFDDRASISSKKMTHGAELPARANTCLTARSLSPTYIFSSSGPFTDMKFSPVSFATA